MECRFGLPLKTDVTEPINREKSPGRKRSFCTLVDKVLAVRRGSSCPLARKAIGDHRAEKSYQTDSVQGSFASSASVSLRRRVNGFVAAVATAKESVHSGPHSQSTTKAAPRGRGPSNAL